MRPSYIALNLGKVPKKKDIPWEMPSWLLELKSVKIFWQDKDVGPATKLLPTIERHKNQNILIVIVDDDMLYHKTLVQRLFEADKLSGGKNVFCFNGHCLPNNLSCNYPSSRRIKSGFRKSAWKSSSKIFWL